MSCYSARDRELRNLKSGLPDGNGSGSQSKFDIFCFSFQTCFVQRVMERLTSLVLSSGRYLSPADAVLLYRQLYVLKNFLEYGTVVANQIRVGYAEEFRYDI